MSDPLPLPGAHPLPDAVCDGGDLDCGSGLLLIIRNAMAPLPGGGVLEVKSREISVKEDLPAWCRMVGHTLLLAAGESYYIRKKAGDDALDAGFFPVADLPKLDVTDTVRRVIARAREITNRV